MERRPTPMSTNARLARLAALGCVGLLAAACGKGPNLHPTVTLEFPHTAPAAPRLVTQNIAPAWTSGHGLAVDGARLLVVDRDNGDLVAMDRATLEVTGRVAVGGRPEQVVVGPDGVALVTVRRTGEVVQVDAGLAVTGRVTLGGEAYGIALGVDGGTAYVTLPQTGELVVLDAASLEELDRVATGDLPRGVAVSPDGWALVVHQNGPARRLPLMASGQLADAPDELVGLRLGNPTDFLSGERLGSLHQGRALAAAIDVERGGALIAHVQAAPGDELSFEMSVRGGIAPDGSPVSAGGGGYGASGGSGAAFDVPVRPIEVSVTGVASSTSSSVLEARHPVQDPLTSEPMTHLVDQPSDIQCSPTLSVALMTGYGTDNVLVLNTAAADPMASPLAIITVGRGPRAVAFSPDGEQAYVLNDHDLTVSVVDLAPLFDMPEAAPTATSDEVIFPNGGFADRMPAESTAGTYFTRPIRLEARASANYGTDPLPAAVRRGARVFTFARNARMSHAGQFACNSCHFEGTEDKLTWFITNGPRQTPALAGRLIDTAPYNWNGTKDDLQGNMVQTVERMGGEGLTAAELADLEQYLLYGLEAPPNPNVAADGQLDAQQLLGRDLFNREDTGCVACHRGAAFTDGFSHDVGTVSDAERRVRELEEAMGVAPEAELGRFNTPTLRGLFYTAPYLHDGSAPTLRDVLDRTGDTMGHTSHLSDAEKDALVAYLKTL
ncbi:MAG: hypothetical protein EP329_11730 [Deltaproteobacteria bacterium]|nr:MAG: hypothetical protein EP329_11730 [Deltaproteobacteria bacterium]